MSARTPAEDPTSRRNWIARACTALGLAFVPAGCARYPSTPAGQTPALLFVTLSVAGRINPSYYYFVALQASPDGTVQSADPNLGPFAVVQVQPGQTSGWGNGWGTGRITDYVVFHGGSATQFSIDTSNPQTYLANVAAGGVSVGPPFSASVSGDGHALTVAVTLASLGLNANPATVRAIPGGVVVNTITTDHLEHDPLAPPKPVDSLEQTGALPQLDLHYSHSVPLPVTTQVLFPNSTVTSADLQITGVQLEVRLP